MIGRTKLASVRAVAVGASAGGVEALGVLLAALPSTLDVPVFVVLHLAASRRSLLPEIFGAQCARPVREVEDKEPIVDGTVYIAPPDYHVLIDTGGQLSLSTDPPVHYSRPSIDVLFESAADAYGSRLLAVLLTGASEDGARGLLRVRTVGGSTIVQDPREALVPTMVQAAIDCGAAEQVMTLAAIAEVLGGLSQARA
ncbi:MAG: chemotaxis protein CheB [Vicinamibacterales bacterium]